MRENDHIRFGRVITNIGGGWIPAQMTFICPQTGYYLFMFVSVTIDRNMAHFSLMVDEEEILDGFSSSSEGSYTGANQVILECEAGTKVWIKAARNGKLHDSGSLSSPTTFTGLLLSRD